MAWHGMAWHGMAWRGVAWHGMAWHVMAWHGMTWHCMAWHGIRDKRFEVEESFEWCGDYSQFKHLLLAHIHPCDRVLILGNGTSDLPECLWRDGRRHITATDLSALVVHRMAQRSTALGSAAVCAAAPAATPATAANPAPDDAAACDCSGTHSEAAAHTATGEAPGGTQPPQQQQLPPSPPSTTRAGSNDVGAVAGGREGQAQHACSGSSGSAANSSGDSSSGCGPRCSSNSSGNSGSGSSSSRSSSNGGGSSGGGGVVCQCGRAVGMTWAVADMMALPFPDACFDVVLEKGVLDVLLVDSDSPWHVPPSIVHRVHTALSQAHRVLTPHGRLLSITFGQWDVGARASGHLLVPCSFPRNILFSFVFGTLLSVPQPPHYHICQCPPPTLTSHHPFAVTLYCSSLSLRATQGTRTPTVTDNTLAADGDSESAGLVITLPQSSDAQPPLDLEHEFMDSDDFFSHCSLGLD
ncbi:unnamed protein product [Closterium sp. NIES-54]